MTGRNPDIPSQPGTEQALRARRTDDGKVLTYSAGWAAQGGNSERCRLWQCVLVQSNVEFQMFGHAPHETDALSFIDRPVRELQFDSHIVFEPKPSGTLSKGNRPPRLNPQSLSLPKWLPSVMGLMEGASGFGMNPCSPSLDSR